MGLFGITKTNTNNKTTVAMLNCLLEVMRDGAIVANESGEVLLSNELGSKIIDAGGLSPIDIVSKNPKLIQFEGKEYGVKYSDIPANIEQKGTLITIFDRNDTSKYEAEIDGLKSELEEANRFKSNFLANMSHEIRTPIHAIIGFSEMVMKQNISEEVKGQIEMIKESSYSLLAIINDVLDLSKLASNKVELVCSNYYISYIIRDIEATFSLMAMRKGLNFEMHLDNNIPGYMYGDKIRIRGVLLNILNNAIKFTKKGTVDFSIHVLEKMRENVKLQFVIRDTGVGIKNEDLERIFDSFSKFNMDSDYVTEGRGLGLSIAKGYIDLMGGTIEVRSKVGVGSEFIVTLVQKMVDDTPIDMEIVNARKKKSEERFLIHDYKVLVVDDNPVNLMVAEGLLKMYGLMADKVTGGREAVDKCKDKEYDMIFMDQMMPEVDGVMAMKEIRQLSSFYNEKCKIIVLTADAMIGVRDRLIGEGFDEYISKPIEVHRLEKILKKFVPDEFIFESSEDIPTSITVEESNAPVVKKDKMEEEIEKISIDLSIDKEILKKKIRDCGGTIDDYIAICKIAEKHAPAKLNKLRESQAIKDYDRYTIEVHSLKSSFAALGAMELSGKAKELEMAGKSGQYDVIDKECENFAAKYSDFVKKLRALILLDEPFEEKEKKEAEEWSAEEVRKISTKILQMVDDFNFGGIFEVLEQLKAMEMGPKTREVFKGIETIMDDMDIDGLKKQLGELI